MDRLYEYRCNRHGVFERMAALHESARPARCPRCNRSAKRVMSAREPQSPQHEPRLADAKKRLPGGRPKLQISHNARPRAFEHS